MKKNRPRNTPIRSRLVGLAATFAVAFALARVATAQGGDPLRPTGPDSTAPDSATPPSAELDSAARALVEADSAETAASPLDSAAAGTDTTRVRAAQSAPPFLPDSSRADTVTARPSRPLDRSAWILWTPRVVDYAIPRWQWYDSLFVPSTPSQLRYPIDARAVRVAVDPEKGTVKTSLEAADVPLAPAREVPFDAYVKDLSSSSLRRAWVDAARTRIRNVPADIDAARGAGLKVALPVELPKAAESILGRGGPSLAVSGSERISIAGTSNWDNRGASGIGVRNSLFPQLDMRQDLDIRLDGSLGDKVNVDVAQNSANTVPLSNRIGIRYKGYEDEVITNLDLGNTNLSMPGTQYVSYSGRNEGLFGAKAAMKFGGTDLALIASKQEGRSERKSFQGTAQEVIRQVDDLNYIKGKYFFLQRPAEQLATNSTIEIGTLRVFVDDRNGSNDQGVRKGTAEIDPTTPAIDSLKSLPGSFDGLRELEDYTVTTEYYGERFPVLVLKNAISNSSVLAVSYLETLADGTPRQIGSVPDCPADVVECPPVRLKIIQATRDRLIADASGEFYETNPAVSPFYPTRDYEIKSFYDLQTRNIDPKSITLQVRRYSSTLDESNDVYREAGQSFSYLQILGVDIFNDNGSGSPSQGPDQLVDQFVNADFLDAEGGILFFPDLRPFDPRVGTRPDTTAEEQFFFRPRIASDPSVPGLRRRILWPAGMANPPGSSAPVTPVELETNPAVYDKRSLLVVSDRRYYIYAKFSGVDYSGTISLGQTNLLENSEVLAVEGVPLERNKDYTIDYEAGIVTLLSAKARQDRSRLTIDYSFAPLFAQAGRTLIGSTASYRGTDVGFGGAFIYEAKGQHEARRAVEVLVLALAAFLLRK